LPIGLRDDEGVDFSLVLPPACTIVLYTDGLIEFTRNLDEGELRLDAAIFSLNGMTDGAAGTIMQRALGDNAATDDIAILTATIGVPVEREAGEMRGWKFSSADRATGVFVRHEVGELIAAWTGDEEQRCNGELAFGEILSNVVRHAPGPVDVRLESSPNGVELTVSDRGSGFAGTLPAPDASSESGRGLHLVVSVADELSISAGDPCGTTVKARFARSRVS
jgi:anti-sigma regulatory factor (Ser/Thr protein kinase)